MCPVSLFTLFVLLLFCIRFALICFAHSTQHTLLIFDRTLPPQAVRPYIGRGSGGPPKFQKSYRNFKSSLILQQKSFKNSIRAPPKFQVMDSLWLPYRHPAKAYRAVGQGGTCPPQPQVGGALGAPPLGCLLILFYILFKIFLKFLKFFEFSKNFSKLSTMLLKFLQSL